MTLPGEDFVLSDDGPVACGGISFIDTRPLEEDAYIEIHHSGRVHRVSGVLAFDALMRLKPSAMEGKALRYKRGAWIAHNLVAHPTMQLVALGGMIVRPFAPLRAKKLYDLAMAIHEVTVPRPIEGRRWQQVSLASSKPASCDGPH